MMDSVVEEIALVPGMTLNQNDEVSNKRKFHGKLEIIQKVNSTKHLKQFILWIILFICLLLITGPLALHIFDAVPAVKPRNIPRHIFSEERAHDYLINLTQYESRVRNTRGNIYAGNYLISQIKRICSMSNRQLRCEVDLQNFTDSDHNELHNVFVRVSNPVTKSKFTPTLLLSAHFDSVEFSPGGSDDGAGVVILLELFSNMINDLTITFTDVHLIVLFTNAEEPGLQGSTAFLFNHRWHYNIHRFINVDAVTCNRVASLIRLKPSQLIIDYSRVLRPRVNVILQNIPVWLGFVTDYDVYNYGSMSGYDFGFFADGYSYHTPLDHPSIIKQGLFQDLGENIGILIRNILLKPVQETIANDPLIYFDILGRYLMVYKISTSIIIQRVLIILIIVVGLILIIFDHIWHRQKSLVCHDSRCIYFQFKYPFILRVISIIIYFISNLISIVVGLLFSMSFSWIMSIIRPVSWYGNPILAIFLFSFPCLIGFITIGYLFDRFHRFVLRKSPKNLSQSNKIHFDFEQNLSVLLIYSVLMIVSIVSGNRLFYLILVWSIFICPIYLLLMIIEFIIHWKQIQWNYFQQKSHWLFLPLMVSLLPLTHTSEIVNRLIRIIIPLLVRRFSFGWSLRGNLIICSIVAIPSVFVVLVFIPVLQRTKHFGRTLIVLLITFFIIFIVACSRQSFTNVHPNTFYAQHISKSIFKVDKLIDTPFIVPMVSQSSSITVATYDGLVLSPVLDQFSAKSGHRLHNKQCFNPTNCTFDDTFNRTIGIQQIEIKSVKNYTIVIRHVLSYNIYISSVSSIKFLVRNQLNLPRTETIIDVIFNSSLVSFQIDIKIRRCDLIDSPFLLLFTRLIANIVPMGETQCQTIDDQAILIINQ